MHDFVQLSFADDLEQRAKFYKDDPAYILGDTAITHGELLNSARKVSSAIYNSGVRHQDRVGVLSMNSIEFGEIMAATQWAGFILAPVNFRLSPSEIASIIRDGSPRLFIFEAQYREIVENIRHELSSVETFVCIGAQTDWAISYDDFIGQGNEQGPPIRAREQ